MVASADDSVCESLVLLWQVSIHESTQIFSALRANIDTGFFISTAQNFDISLKVQWLSKDGTFDHDLIKEIWSIELGRAAKHEVVLEAGHEAAPRLLWIIRIRGALTTDTRVEHPDVELLSQLTVFVMKWADESICEFLV